MKLHERGLAMSKILIVEDEESIADIEKDYLELNGYEVEVCNDGTSGLAAALHEDIDMCILDIMLPGTDGFEICKQVREVKDIPIIMVSAKKEDIDKIRGLGVGADDYMTKPFSPSELVARVKAHLARYDRLVSNSKNNNNIIEIRGIKIDKTARRVFVNGEEKPFTTKEFDLLTFLAENPNHVFTKEELFKEIWDMVYAYIDFVRKNGYFEHRRNEQAKYWMYETINEHLRDSFYQNPEIASLLPLQEKDVLEGRATSFSAARKLLEMYFSGLKQE